MDDRWSVALLQLVSNVGFFRSHRRSASLPAGRLQSSISWI